MTPDKQNAVIAIACGIVTHDHWGPLYRTPQGLVRVCPDFHGDLNAMHEAEKVLTADQWYEYGSLMPLRDPQKMHANAAEKAEAFLRTVGLWTPTPTQPQ